MLEDQFKVGREPEGSQTPNKVKHMQALLSLCFGRDRVENKKKVTLLKLFF